MMSTVWRQAAKGCLGTPIRGLYRPSLVCRRYAAAAATASEPVRDPGAPAVPLDTPLNTQGRPFQTLEGVVSEQTLQAITVRPFKLTNMTPVQEEVLGLLPGLAATPEQRKNSDQPRDLLVRSKTGTGKTLAFLVPAIEARIKAIEAHGLQAVKDAGLVNDPELRARAEKRYARETVGTLIISPTRELATQIANEALRLSYHHKGFEVQLFTGGTSKMRQVRDWMKGRRDIVVATTGRLRDLLSTEPAVTSALEQTNTLILDEADTLLDMGFREDISAIAEYLPNTETRQTFLFSATIPAAVREIARQHLNKNHKFINTVPSDESPVHAHIPQYSTVLPSGAHQIPYIMKLLAHEQLSSPAGSKTIVFFPTTRMTQLFATIVRELRDKLLPAGNATVVYELHSKKEQRSRTNTSSQFRAEKKSHSVLITSDVSARGVDYPGVTRVIQIGIPASTDQYIHRVGRTGRAGSHVGRGDILFLPWEVGFLTWQLVDVPIKSVTTTEFNDQLHKLCEAYDANPQAFTGATVSRTDRHGRRTPVPRPKQMTMLLDEYGSTVSELLTKLDEDALRETFLSLLGYYLSKSSELRVSRDVVLEGLRSWTTEAVGLSAPPYVSDAFLQRMGFDDNRTKKFGQRLDPSSRKHSRENRWSGRGQQRTRDLPKTRRGSTGELDESEFNLNPNEYRTPRYGSKARPWLHQSRQDSEGFRYSRSRQDSEGSRYSRPRRESEGSRYDRSR